MGTEDSSVKRGTRLDQGFARSDQQLAIWVRIVMAIFSLGAMLIAGYLFAVSSVIGGQPVGCGQGSGCSEVLTSRWSQVFGVPVTVPAAFTYLLLFVCALRPEAFASGLGRWVVRFSASLLVLAAIWFVGLQGFYLGAWCPWCLVEHVLGLFLAATVFFGLGTSQRNMSAVPNDSSPETAAHQKSGRLATSISAFGCAALAFLILIAAQIWGPFEATPAGRLSGTGGQTEGEGLGRQVSLLDGKLQLSLSQVPVMGNPQAKHLLVMLFDYCCPHCQTTHGYLREAVKQRPEDLAVILLPMPLNSKCNPHWKNDEPRFAESCELAKLALAMHAVDPEKFGHFDDWLFESEEPRTLAEARQQAASVVGSEELESSLSQSDLDVQIRRNVDAYHLSQAGRIPVIMSPDFDAVVGRPGSRSELLGILRDELGLQFD